MLVAQGPALALFLGQAAGGEGGIRTHGTVAGTRAFQARRFVHSRTSPSDVNDNIAPLLLTLTTTSELSNDITTPGSLSDLGVRREGKRG